VAVVHFEDPAAENPAASTAMTLPLAGLPSSILVSMCHASSGFIAPPSGALPALAAPKMKVFP
jgi:hypothetical protein